MSFVEYKMKLWKGFNDEADDEKPLTEHEKALYQKIAERRAAEREKRGFRWKGKA